MLGAGGSGYGQAVHGKRRLGRILYDAEFGNRLGLDHVDVDLHVWEWSFDVDHSALYLYGEQRRASYGDPGRSHVSVYLDPESGHRTSGRQ